MTMMVVSIYLLGVFVVFGVCTYEHTRDGVGFDESLPASLFTSVLWPVVVPFVLAYRLGKWLAKERIKV